MTTFCLKNSNSRNSNYNFKKDKFSQMCANIFLFLLFYGFIANLLHKLERVRCEYCTGRGGATRRDLTELISTF